MMPYPSLYQINTRVILQERSRQLGKAATLDDLVDDYLDRIAGHGFDGVWFLGVWQTGAAGRQVSLMQPQWRQGYQAALPDFTDDDVVGSPYAVREYRVDERLGGPDALARLRQRLRQRGLRLLLDFVPNHTALDHPWARTHPEYYVQGTADDLQRQPQNYLRLETDHGQVIFAHGRDPYFDGWPDTLQLNYHHQGMRSALLDQLLLIAEQCDGLRCDMAMLVLPDIFLRTWGDRARPADGTAPVEELFWPAAIGAARQRRPDFLFMAEVYWDLEWVLQQQGFDYTYDKRLYDRLRARDTAGVRGHLHADKTFQDRSARFLENHDEPRAASAFPPGVHEAAAVITFLVPGLRFFHEGQLEGRRVHVSMHLQRRPEEPTDPVLAEFYARLLDVLRSPAVRTGRWQLVDCRSAWDGNPTWQQFLIFAWEETGSARVLVIVNFGPAQGQCYVVLPFSDLTGRTWLLRDATSKTRYEREGDGLAGNGLYLDLPAWGYHVFELI